MTESQAHYLLILSGIQTFAIFIGFVALAVLGFTVARLLKVVVELSEEAKGKVYPILQNVQHISEKVADISSVARDFTADAAPKLRRVADNVAATSDNYRARLDDINDLVADTTNKARRQTERVDAAVNNVVHRTQDVVHSTLERAHSVVDTLHRAIFAPVRQASGIFSGAKAGLEALVDNFSTKHETIGSDRATIREHRTPRPVAFEGESVYTGKPDDYHA